jgi:hypothetical protein
LEDFLVVEVLEAFLAGAALTVFLATLFVVFATDFLATVLVGTLAVVFVVFVTLFFEFKLINFPF